MKGMPLPFDFHGKGGLDCYTSILSSSDPYILHKWDSQGVVLEPNSVLDNISSPNPPTPTSTLSSSLGGSCSRGGGGGSCSTDTAEVAAVSGNPSPKWSAQHEAGNSSDLQPVPPSLEIAGGNSYRNATVAALGMEDWDGVLSASVAASPGQDQSLLRWIMGDVEDPNLGFNKMLQIGGAGGGLAADFDLSGGFGALDQAFGLDPPSNPSNFKFPNPQNPIFSPLSNNLGPISLNQQPQQAPFHTSEMKPHIFNPQVSINHNQAQQTQNQAFFLPVPYTNHQEQHYFMGQQSKRHNSGNVEPKGPFLDSGQQSFQGIPHYQQQMPSTAGDELGHQQQQAIIDQIYKVSESVQSGNLILAQGILARLNQQLPPIGKPFHRAAYYCKEALQLLLQNDNNMASNSPFSLIYKIGAYKSFSEISPFLQFANFTCNQALLEALDGFDRIHIIDFDIGYGGQWASFMQELALKNGGTPTLKITAFASPSTHDQLELGLTRENLNYFASEINIAFEFEIVSLDILNSTTWALPLHVSENEAIAVNLPAGSVFNYQVSLPLVLRFIKQLCPKIIVSLDRGCDRTDLPFPNHVIHALQSYSNLLESLDAVNVNQDALQKIERFLLQPGVEKIIVGRYRSPGKTQHWRSLFLSSGFSPLTFSNFTESQAECVIKRTPIRGFHIEKRQSSLVLCWQRRELISASAWRC